MTDKFRYAWFSHNLSTNCWWRTNQKLCCAFTVSFAAMQRILGCFCHFFAMFVASSFSSHPPPPPPFQPPPPSFLVDCTVYDCVFCYTFNVFMTVFVVLSSFSHGGRCLINYIAFFRFFKFFICDSHYVTLTVSRMSEWNVQFTKISPVHIHL